MHKEEQGAAEIRIKLENSTITVHHFDGTLLHSRSAIEGDWSKIWAVLKPTGVKGYRDLSPEEVEQYADENALNIETEENYREAAIKVFELKYMDAINAFFNQWGINIQGICNEAGIAKQYLNRCRKNRELPGQKVMDKLLPIMNKYGF